MTFNQVIELLLEELKIVAPAVKLPSGKVVPGKLGDMHVDVYERIIRRLSEINNVPIEVAEKKFYKMFEGGKIEAGFIDNQGHYHTREEAWHIAKKNNKEVEKLDKNPNKRINKLVTELLPDTKLRPQLS